MIKKATHRELAEYLGKSVDTVKKYPPEKLTLMLLGLTVVKEARDARRDPKRDT